MTAAMLLHGYNDFTRPAYFQPIKGPHWSYATDQHLADWHLKTREAIKARTPQVKVGGHCMVVPYFYLE